MFHNRSHPPHPTRLFALLILGSFACGPQSTEFLELARRQSPPSPEIIAGVVHFQNEVVPNARVTIIELSRRRHEVQTDELGRFSLDVPNRQVQLVVASAGGLVGLAADPPQDTVDVQLRVPWRVSGVVRDAAGAPVAGARVLGSWSVSTCTGPYEGQPLFETTTSATGAYEVTVPVSHAWIAAVANGLASKSTIDLTGAPESSPFDLALPAEPSELTAELAALVRRPR